jgi:glutamate/tyrosine decarboxylase-like PLP-dependent enzyme
MRYIVGEILHFCKIVLVAVKITVSVLVCNLALSLIIHKFFLDKLQLAMNQLLQTDLNNFDHILERAKMVGVEYLHSLDSRPTNSAHTISTYNQLQENGAGAEGSLEQFLERFERLIVASSGARYLGFVTGGSTPASIVGDWLATVYDQNPQGTIGQGDISATIELETIALLRDLFGLPDDFIGGFVTGATMSNFTCLGVARQWLGKQHSEDIAKNGVTSVMPILAATPHSSSLKALSMLGLGSRMFTKLKVMDGNREAIDIADLEKALQTLNGQPSILITSAGTVNTVDFDDFRAIAALRDRYTFWWHIDGAFGAFAACSPNTAHLVEGWSMADSITVDCHKWLNVPYESAVFFVRKEHSILQTETFQNSSAPYLGDPFEKFSFLNFLPENSRRLRALPTWFSLVGYGKKGYRDIVENSIQMAQLLGTFIEKHPKFRLLAPVRLNTVCFSLSGNPSATSVQEYLTALNATGKVFMTPTSYNGSKGIRAAFVNWRTNAEDVSLIIAIMQEVLDSTGL